MKDCSASQMIDSASLVFLTQICGLFGNCLTNNKFLKEDCVPDSAKACVASYMSCFVHHLLLTKNNKCSWPRFLLKLSGEVDLPWGLCLWKSWVKGCVLKDRILLPTRPPDKAGASYWSGPRRIRMRGTVGPWSNMNSWIQFIITKIYPSSFLPKSLRMRYSSLPKRNSPTIKFRVQRMSSELPDSPHKICLEWEPRGPFSLQSPFSPHVPTDAQSPPWVLPTSWGWSRQ